jgi:plastocyanin
MQRLISRGLVILGAGFLLWPVVSWAAVVKGRVNGVQKLVNPVWNEAKEPGANRYTWREPSPTVRAEFRALFPHAPKEVCIAAIGGAAATPPGNPMALRIGGGRTSPVTLVVAPGTVIEFQNRDPFPHRPYLVGNATFQASDMKGASSRQWKVPSPGKYELRDQLAPSIRSWIVAEPNVAAVAYPGRDGVFTFANLPPGEYTLKAFFNGEAVGKPVPLKVASEIPMELKEPVVVAEDAPPPGKK